MGWERRGNGIYLYTAQRYGQKVEKRYIGKGPGALVVAGEISRQARKRKQAVQDVRDFEASLWSLDKSMRLFRDAARQAIHSAHYVAGFEQTRCYHWRKGFTMSKSHQKAQGSQTSKREAPSTTDTAQIGKTDNQGESKADDAGSTTANREPTCIADTLRAIKSGRRDLLNLLRRQLASVPELWRQVGDLTRLTIEGWARQIAGDDLLLRESIVLCAQEERKQLASVASTPMERVIADRVVVTRLQRHYYEQVSAVGASTLLGTKLHEAVAKRLHSAELEFREAVRHLSKVRELQTEMSPDGPAAGVSVALRVFDPDRKRKSA